MLAAPPEPMYLVIVIVPLLVVQVKSNGTMKSVPLEPVPFLETMR